jgi:hypothetical protein
VLYFSAIATNSSFVSLEINSEGALTYVDGVAVAPGFTNCVPEHDSVVSHDRPVGTSQSAVPPYVYPEGENKIEGELGQDLARLMLTNGDEALADRISFSSNDVWVTYYLNQYTNWTHMSGSPSNAALSGSASVWFSRPGDRERTVFYPFTSTNVPGTTNTLYQYWNLVALPSASSPTAIPDAGLPNGVGDKIRIVRDGSEIKVYWSTRYDEWRVQTGTLPTLLPGESFLYYKAASGEYTWTP